MDAKGISEYPANVEGIDPDWEQKRYEAEKAAKDGDRNDDEQPRK